MLGHQSADLEHFRLFRGIFQQVSDLFARHFFLGKIERVPQSTIADHALESAACSATGNALAANIDRSVHGRLLR